MLIEEVDRQAIRNTAEFRKALDATSGDQVLLLVRDDRAARFLVLAR